MFTNSKKQKRVTSFFVSKTPNKRSRRDDSKSVKEHSSFGVCPLCNRSFSLHTLESHAALCTGESAKSSIVTPQKPILKPSSEPIPGLYLYDDFISEEEETAILQFLDTESIQWKTSRFNGHQFGKRWGVHCNLRDRRVNAAENPLPDFIQQILVPKLKDLPTVKGCVPNEANAIDYRRMQGHWLKSHVDDRKLSKEPICNLSLAGDCYMTFKNVAMHRNLALKEQKVLLNRRCLQVLTGSARYDFTHAIANVDLLSDRRVSVTMRESPLTVLAPSQMKLNAAVADNRQKSAGHK
ncbi:MAG: hypothetical protein SGBAC_007217 [Bacillariaceae sp.]